MIPTKQQSIIFVAAEAAPYSKTGGLGDVAGSLTIALAERGHRVMVVVPRYQTCARDRYLLRGLHNCSTWLRLDLGNGEHWVNYHHEARRGVDWVFVEHVSFERDGGLYGNSHGIYADNLFRCVPPTPPPHVNIQYSHALAPDDACAVGSSGWWCLRVGEVREPTCRGMLRARCVPRPYTCRLPVKHLLVWCCASSWRYRRHSWRDCGL